MKYLQIFVIVLVVGLCFAQRGKDGVLNMFYMYIIILIILLVPVAMSKNTI